MRLRLDPVITISMLLMGAALIAIGPAGKLDARLWYTTEMAASYFRSLSPDDRMTYFWGEFLDYLFMLNYTLFLHGLYKKLVIEERSRMVRLAFLPGIIDFLETLSIQLVLANRLPETFALLPWFTFLKWSGIFFVATSLLQLFLKRRRFTRS